MKKKTLIILGVILFMTAITRRNSNGSRKEIEARFEGFVSLYPTATATVYLTTCQVNCCSCQLVKVFKF